VFIGEVVVAAQARQTFSKVPFIYSSKVSFTVM